MRVITDDGEQLGIMAVKDAQKLAIERRLDLIEIVPNAEPPVCRLMDFGKYKYELAKKEKHQKKHQHITLVKEVRFHPNTDTHDFEFKVRHARGFIEEGHKVKAAVVFKGREITYQAHGRELLDRFTERLDDIAKVDQPGKMEGRQMVAYFVPDKTKKKVEPKQTKEKTAEQNQTKEKTAEPNQTKEKTAG